MAIKTKVFSPRGKRWDGGGLALQVTIEQEEVERWMRPSALERVVFSRRLQRALREGEREVGEALVALEEGRRIERAAQEGRASEPSVAAGRVEAEGPGPA